MIPSPTGFRVRIVGVLALVVAGLTGLAACKGDAPQAPQGVIGSYAVPCHMTQGGTGIVASSGCTVSIESGAVLAIDSGASVTGVITNDLNSANLIIDATGNTGLRATQDNRPILTLGGTPTAASFTVNDSQGVAALTIRGNGELASLRYLTAATAAPLAGVASTAIAPVGLLQPVSMATAGTVPITIPPAGTIFCVWNTGSETVTIADSGNQVLSASGALGQYDSICFFSDGTRAIEFARSNN